MIPVAKSVYSSNSALRPEEVANPFQSSLLEPHHKLLGSQSEGNVPAEGSYVSPKVGESHFSVSLLFHPKHVYFTFEQILVIAAKPFSVKPSLLFKFQEQVISSGRLKSNLIKRSGGSQTYKIQANINQFEIVDLEELSRERAPHFSIEIVDDLTDETLCRGQFTFWEVCHLGVFRLNFMYLRPESDAPGGSAVYVKF